MSDDGNRKTQKTEIFISGVPAPQGSKTLVGANTGRARMIEGSSTSGRQKLRSWRQAVTAAFKTVDPIGDTPVAIEIHFYMPKLKTGSNLTHAVKPDLDKLCRATFDAISDSGYWRDDSRVTHLTATKQRHHKTGAKIIVTKK